MKYIHSLTRILRTGFVKTLLPLTFVLGGCTTLGPDYQEPEISWLKDWSTELYDKVPSTEQVQETSLSTWWHLFSDPILNKLIQEAQVENHSLQIAGLRILESRAVLGVAGSASYPQVQQVSGALAHVNSQKHGGIAVNRDQSLTSFQSSFDLGWEIDFWGRFQRGIESADAAFMTSISNQHDAQVLLTAQVVDLYYAYRTTQLRIEIAEQNASIQKRSFDISQKQYESGQESELDLHQAKTQYLATLSTIPGLHISLNKTANALSVLLGRVPGDIPVLEDRIESLPEVKAHMLQAIPANLLLRRPDVRAALWKVAAQSAQIGIAKADLYPSISLFGSIGWSENSLGASPDVVTQSIGPMFKWNVFDYGRLKNNVLVQDTRLQQLITQYQLQALQAAREVEDAAITIIKTGEQKEILSQSVASAERALGLANTRYKEGYAGFQRVLDAQRAKFAQEDRERLNQSAHISAVISLYKSLGGGWANISAENLLKPSVKETMMQRVDWEDKLDQSLPVVSEPLINEVNKHE